MIEYLTTIAAFGGLLLGVFNTARNVIHDRKIKLTVMPQFHEHALTLNIVNLSAFPVIVSGYGFMLKGILKLPVPSTEARLEPRNGLYADISWSDMIDVATRTKGHLVQAIYVDTRCGTTICHAVDPALAQLFFSHLPVENTSE